MKGTKSVKDMDDKEFLEKYASKKAIDDAGKRSQEKLRKEKIAELDSGMKRAEDYLKKNDPELYHTALAELQRVKSEIDFYHGKSARLTKEDFNHYDNKVKSEINGIIKTAEHKLSKANPSEQKAYKEVIEEAEGYLRKGEETAKQVLEKIEKSLTNEKFKKDIESLRDKFGQEKSNEAVEAYKTLASSVKDTKYEIECLKEAKERHAPNKEVEDYLQKKIDSLSVITIGRRAIEKAKLKH